MADGQYSFSLTTFSPSGKLVQIEYALNRVQQGAPALGIKAKNGVVLAAEKKLPTPLLEAETISKVDTFTPSVGCVFAGMPADFRVVLKKGRKEVRIGHKIKSFKALYIVRTPYVYAYIVHAPYIHCTVCVYSTQTTNSNKKPMRVARQYACCICMHKQKQAETGIETNPKKKRKQKRRKKWKYFCFVHAVGSICSWSLYTMEQVLAAARCLCLLFIYNE